MTFKYSNMYFSSENIIDMINFIQIMEELNVVHDLYELNYGCLQSFVILHHNDDIPIMFFNYSSLRDYVFGIESLLDLKCFISENNVLNLKVIFKTKSINWKMGL